MTTLTTQFLVHAPNSFTRTFLSVQMPIIVSRRHSRPHLLEGSERAGGVSLFRLSFALLFARLLMLFLSAFAFERQFFVFPSLFRLVHFASRFFSPPPRNTLWLRARYDLAVSCFLLTVLRHKICCSGCWCHFTFPRTHRAASHSRMSLSTTSSRSRLAHVYTLAAAYASPSPRIRGCVYRSHSSSVVYHSLYFRGELFNILYIIEMFPPWWLPEASFHFRCTLHNPGSSPVCHVSNQRRGRGRITHPQPVNGWPSTTPV